MSGLAGCPAGVSELLGVCVWGEGGWGDPRTSGCECDSDVRVEETHRRRGFFLTQSPRNTTWTGG